MTGLGEDRQCDYREQRPLTTNPLITVFDGVGRFPGHAFREIPPDIPPLISIGTGHSALPVNVLQAYI